MIIKEHVWTKVEKEWKKRLAGNDKYDLVTLGEAFKQAPPLTATDQMRAKYGDWQGTWCSLYYAHIQMSNMPDNVVLVHGTLNCNACSTAFHTWCADATGCMVPNTPATAIDRRQVILGGEQELYEAIKAVDRDYRPKLITIIQGCATGLVQDDMRHVLQKAQPEVGAKLFFIPTAGYEAQYNGQMIEIVSAEWVKLMDPPAKIDKNAVNIVGMTREPYGPHTGKGTCTNRRYPSDSEELSRYIEAMRLKVHRVLWGGDYEYVRTAPQAGVNMVYCSTWGFPLAEAMKNKFGTPYVREELPLGVGPASAWIRGLGAQTGRQEEAEKVIKAEYEAIKDVYERCREMVAGKTVIMGGAVNRVLSNLRFCHELGDTCFSRGRQGKVTSS